MAPNNQKVVSFCMESLDQILESMKRNMKHYICASVYNLRIGFTDNTEIDRASILGPVITFISASESKGSASKHYRVIPSEFCHKN